jgi:2-C-methyl-D-erythritol 4-phosphate cytidylyltransferase
MARETVKQVKNGKIAATLDRREIALAQTPQVFSYGLLQQALAIDLVVTDEASAVEALGLQPCAILGDPDNIKITLPQDMKVAEIALTEILEQERQA